MAIPSLPWYGKLKEIVAPTEQAANFALIIIILVCIWALLKGSPIQKAGLVVYIVSP
jgi:hypothetical protein